MRYSVLRKYRKSFSDAALDQLCLLDVLVYDCPLKEKLQDLIICISCLCHLVCCPLAHPQTMSVPGDSDHKTFSAIAE